MGLNSMATVLVALCLLTAVIVLASLLVFPKMEKLPPVIPLKYDENGPYIEVVWEDGTKTKHYVKKGGEAVKTV